MHRLSARTLTVVSLVGLLAAASLPAQAKSSRPKQHRGKKAIGEIVSFDQATSTLVVDLPGEDFTGAVDPDVRVKLDHRGWAKKGSSHGGNPTEGSLDDLLPGTPVLRMKVEDDLVTKIRIRPVADAAPLPPAEDGDEDDAGETDAEDGADSDDPTDDSTDDDSTDDSDSNPDDEDLGDTEDALPPLPATQP